MVTGLTHTGNFYRFKIRVFNEIDFITSEYEPILLAAVPDKPLINPWQDFTLTS
jgi:hypothetical protein